MTIDESRADAEVRIGLLYPTRDSGEDDFVRLAARLGPWLRIGVGYVPWGDSVSDLADLDGPAVHAALRELSEPARLQHAVADLGDFAPHVLTWACTSCSFLLGLDRASDQAAELSRRSGIPASSTSLAFVAAARAIGVSRVGVASVYDTDATAAFIEFLGAAGIPTVHSVSMHAPSDRALAGWDRAQILDLTAAGDSPDAEAILVPETALHTADLLAELESRAGKPVLTATQVTIWQALRQVGRAAPAPGLGALFEQAGN